MNLTPEFLLSHFHDAPLWRLSHPDGSAYLDRYCLWGDDSLENHGSESHCFLHRIYTADGDRDPHNHPWIWSMAQVLRGGYTEKRVDALYVPVFHYYGIGDVNRLSNHDYHSVVSVEADTWTLFQAGKETQDWGFLTWSPSAYRVTEHIPHAEYFKRPDVKCMKTERIK